MKSDKEKDALAYDCAKFFYELHSSDVRKIDATLTGMRPIIQNMEKYLSQYFTVQEIENKLESTPQVDGTTNTNSTLPSENPK